MFHVQNTCLVQVVLCKVLNICGVISMIYWRVDHKNVVDLFHTTQQRKLSGELDRKYESLASMLKL